MRRWFLSYNSQDFALADALAARLRRRDPQAAIFLAPESLRPGAYWMPALAAEIAAATGFILLIGSNGLGPWQTIEYYEAYDRRVKQRDFPVVLVLLDGQPAPGLPFLRQLHWIVTADPAAEMSVAQLLDAMEDDGAPPGELWRYTAPYRGLAAMTEADADFFFGRGRETAETVGVLAAAPDKLALLLGNSGVGKSSLAQAGGVAALLRQAWPETADVSGPWPQVFNDSRRWCFLKLSPGAEPVRALVEPFLRIWQFDAVDPKRARLLSSWTANLVSGSAGLRDLMDATEARYHDDLKQPAPPAFLLYIDQGEELYLRAGEHERRRFSELIAAGLADRRLHAMASLRADFFGELQKDEALYSAHRLVSVPPLREAELREVVDRPAALLRARFETERLAADIARRTAEESAVDAGALPLLSYLLDDMWMRMVERNDGVLRLPAQAIELGGVLVERGEAFVAAHPDSEGALKRIFTLKLATVREDGEPARRRALRSEFSDEEWRLVGELADHPNRLVVTAAPEGGEAHAEIAHEAVFRRWNRLRQWIAEARDFLIWKATLEVDRRAWEKAPDGARSDALLMGLRLAQAQGWLVRRKADLPKADRDFIAASRRAAHWRRARLWGMVASAPILVALIIIVVWIAMIGLGVRRVEAEWAKEHAFVRIPPAGVLAPYCFMMGSSAIKGAPQYDPQRDNDEGPVHKVCLKPFDLDRYDVTQWEWRQVMIPIPGMIFPFNSDSSGPHLKGDGRKPVVNVSWNDAWWFVHLMSWLGSHHYRLPSEAEWEYAARAGTATPFFWGARAAGGCAYAKMADAHWNVVGALRIYCNQYMSGNVYNPGATPVGSLKPNPWGLYDMLGNVFQWVEDCSINSYRVTPRDGSAYIKGPCTYRVLRGGSWKSSPRFARAASRVDATPDYRDGILGFRVARTIVR
jgi:formylglycine-generating enzyme required for sulfatase activity